MAAAAVEEDPVVQAARILVTLRNRKLLRWPEWVQKEPATAVVEVRWPLEGCPKRTRNGGRRPGGWLAVPLKLVVAASSASAGSGLCSSGWERECSPAPARRRERLTSQQELTAVQRPDSPAYCSALAGSAPSTSADRKARPRHAVEREATASPAPVSASTKEPMKAPSPETPLDFSTSATGSGASSSGDDATQTPSKRKAPGSVGGLSSSDEGCSSPDKRARRDDCDGDGVKAIAEPPKMQQIPSDDSKKAVKFEFDLNMLPEDDGCHGFC